MHRAAGLSRKGCSDCGWRNVVVEDKDAQTETTTDNVCFTRGSLHIFASMYFMSYLTQSD